MRNKIFVILLFFVLAFPFSLEAQPGRALTEMKRGDSLREAYRFDEALEVYGDAMAMLPDSITMDDSLLKMDISDRLLMAENGRSMMDFVYKPHVIARHRFSIEEFFLYYPLPDNSWRSLPCQIDSTVHRLSKAVYVPDGKDVIYWSASDSEGVRNIYKTEFRDSIWTVPALLNEGMTSMGDEIYPMLSPDGKKMYFSSEGLYGVGGQDLYVSEWDEVANDWSLPVNMGFPYSSPADDFLLANSEDGRYTVFASNRDCPADSVWVYVIEYDDIPVRYPVLDEEELRHIAMLEPEDEEDSTEEVATDIPENIDTRRYMSKMSEVRSLRDSISLLGMKMEDARVRYAQSVRDEEKASLETSIIEYELLIPVLQDSLERASAQLQEIEMEFLFSGVVIDPDKLLAEADREIAGQTAEYVFARRRMGSPLSLRMQEPEPTFDYSFKILDEGQFAEDQTLPKGLIYQIQMFALQKKATVKQLKGLSPVFESLTPKGKYVYKVGLFSTYSDVLAHLNAVKKAGFRNAFIVAAFDGKEMAVSKARAKEAELQEKASFYEVRINTGSSELDFAISGGIRQQAAGKDIARTIDSSGANIYVVGPFADKESAEKVAGFVRAMGVADTEVSKIVKK